MGRMIIGVDPHKASVTIEVTDELREISGRRRGSVVNTAVMLLVVAPVVSLDVARPDTGTQVAGLGAPKLIMAGASVRDLAIVMMETTDMHVTHAYGDGTAGPSSRSWRATPARAVFVTAATTVAGPATLGKPTSDAEATRVMMLGDSITAAPGCWRVPISKLTIGGRRVDMVGSQNNASSCGGKWDGDHEGHDGITAAQVAGNRLRRWLNSAKPDVVGVYLGSNDIARGRSTKKIVKSMDKIVRQIRRKNSTARVLVAQLPPLALPGCRDCAARTAALDDGLRAWSRNAEVQLVDLRPGWNPAADTLDGVHPNRSGTDKLARRWVSALLG